MNITTSFPSKYLKAADLQGRTVEVRIDRVVLESVGQGNDAEEKPVIYFQGKEKGIVLNKVNSSTISSAYGDETDNWSGQPLSIYPDKTSFKGEIVDCLRVRVTAAEPAPAEGEVPF